MEGRRPAQGPVRERGQAERQEREEREETARRGRVAVHGGVREQEGSQSGVEGLPVLGGQGAQGPQRHALRPVEEGLAGLLGPAADAGQRGVDGGDLRLRARRVVLVISGIVEDLGHEARGELAGGASLRLLSELLASEVEGLTVPLGPVPENREAERVDPLARSDAFLGVVLVARVVADAEVHVVEKDLEGAVRVVRREGDGAGRSLSGVLESGLGLRGVEARRLDGEGAQVAEELVGDRLPFVGGHPAGLRHGPDLSPDPIREILARRRNDCLAHLMTLCPHCTAPCCRSARTA